MDVHNRRGQICTIDRLRAFMTAGSATLTIVSLKTQTRFTYKLVKSDPEKAVKPGNEVIFVRLLSGPDNEGDFTFMGTLFPSQSGWWTYRHSAKSRIGFNAGSVAAFSYLMRVTTLAKEIPPELEVWHEGRCGRCNRKLTVPGSIEIGFGPDCAEILGLEFAGQTRLEFA